MQIVDIPLQRPGYAPLTESDFRLRVRDQRFALEYGGYRAYYSNGGFSDTTPEGTYGGLYRWRSTGSDTGTITLNTIAWSEGAPSNAYLLLRSVPRLMGRFLGVYRRRNGGREFLGNHQKV